MPGRAWLLALATVALPAVGCAPVPEAPTELSDLIRYLYRELENDDPRVLEAGIENLHDFLADVDLDGALEDRSYIPDNLTVDDVAGLTVPDYPLEDCISVAVAAPSRYAVPWHAKLMIEEDQTPAEPSAEWYVRTFTDPDDPQDFADDAAERAHCDNDIRRTNLIYKMEYTMPKAFRWVAVTDDGDPTGGRTALGRSWLDLSWWGDEGNVEMRQSYSLDVWHDAGGDGSWRLHCLFTDTRIPGVDDPDVIRGISRGSIDDSFEAVDDAIEELYAP